MALELENSSEAFLAVLAVVVGVDGVGSFAEHDYLFERVKGLPSFSSLGKAEFRELLEQVTDKVYSALPQIDGAITSAGMDELLTVAKNLLTPELRQAVLKSAAQLSESDETGAAEAALLSQIRRAFA